MIGAMAAYAEAALSKISAGWAANGALSVMVD